jgi:hypothetical protein
MTPLARPIEIPSGRHFVAVTRRGYQAFAEDVDFARGEAKTLTVRLEVTGQRTASLALIGVGVAGLLAGGTLAAVAVAQQGKAETLDTQRLTQGGLTESDLAQYNGYVSTRNELRTAAGVAFAGAAVVGATGILLAVFDQPVVGAGADVRARRDDAPQPAAPAPGERPMELSVTPLFAPGLFGAALYGRF